ncbi:hypothetical protein GWI33_012703 [Rhynchophorus ferrugineus]|uniref:Uncharacterized protein n=1 Tax=Rhynchophorus ferrugineus TaxID=354439 RepID=A0A834MC79_RHYFE|nr:hypothetical protein GWI33_012703 [Rhynchophorus ferrugineus]
MLISSNSKVHRLKSNVVMPRESSPVRNRKRILYLDEEPTYRSWCLQLWLGSEKIIHKPNNESTLTTIWDKSQTYWVTVKDKDNFETTKPEAASKNVKRNRFKKFFRRIFDKIGAVFEVKNVNHAKHLNHHIQNPFLVI